MFCLFFDDQIIFPWEIYMSFVINFIGNKRPLNYQLSASGAIPELSLTLYNAEKNVITK